MSKKQRRRQFLAKTAARIFGGQEVAMDRNALAALLDAHGLDDMLARLNLGPIFGDDADGEEPKPYEMLDGVAVIRLEGVVTHGLTEEERWWFGALDTVEVGDALDAAAADSQTRAIVLAVNSPGGLIVGVPELAAKVRAVAARVPVIAYTDSLMASAAYWIASGASAIYCSESATVGAVGVYRVAWDFSKAREKAGIRLDVIRSGENKAAGVENTPLTEAQRAEEQRKIDDLGAAFRAAVTVGRGKLADDVLDGRDFFGTEAVRNGLADSLATLAEAVADARTLAEMRPPAPLPGGYGNPNNNGD